MIFFVVVCIGWVFSVCVHEFAHAVVAYLGGDRGVAEKGYLTMNPLRYAHPVYSLALPLLLVILGGVGLPGGAVYVNDGMLRSRWWRAAVSLAGPAASAVMMLLFAAPFLLGVFPPGDRGERACCAAFLVGLQASAVVLNLLPIPPLDGFRAIQPFLPLHVGHKIARYGNNLFFVLLAAMWFVQSVADAYWGTVQAILAVFGVDFDLFSMGWERFRFWTAWW